MSVSTELLEAIPALSAAGEEARARLAAEGEEVTIPAGGVLFAEGDPADDVYFLLEGRVTLGLRIGGRELLVLSLGPGELTGWSGVLPHGRVATARATSPTRALRLPGRVLLEVCEADHALGYRVMRHLFGELARRLHDTRLQLLDVFGRPGER
jgi:CRP-like cAMP-binding protein